MVEAPHDQHKRLVNYIHSKKYPMKGKFRDGYCTPMVSEIRFYDIRLKEKVEKEFLQDMQANSCLIAYEHQPKGYNLGDHLGILPTVARKVKILLNRLTPLKSVHIPKRDGRRNEIGGWSISFLIGKVKDRINECGEEWL